MTTSTRRTFTASPTGAQVTESVQLSQSAAARALASQTSRLTTSADRQQQAAATAQQTAFYRGQGEYSTLGADGKYRPRGSVTSGGVPIGQAVPASGGLMGGMPAGDSGDGAGLRALAERVAEVAQSAGPQIGTENPNESSAAPRYPQDQYYEQVSGVTWQWRTTAGAEAGEWIPVSGGGAIIYGVGDPVVNAVPVQLGKFYLDQTLGRLYASMPSLTIGSSAAFWVPSGPYTFDNATMAVAQAFYSGDIYQGPTSHGIADASGGMFYRLNSSGAWVPQFTCCPEVPPPPAASCDTAGYEIGPIVWDPTGPGPAIGIWYVNIRFPCS